MAVLEAPRRTRSRVCPTCGKTRYTKSFDPNEVECYYCIQERVGERRCTGCGETKPLEEFAPSNVREKIWRCRPCQRIYKRDWAARNPEKVAAASRKHTSGVTRQEYDAAVATTTACPICAEPFSKTPHADHDHETGRFRGVLCGSCNMALGLLNDNLDALRRAIAYLEG